jgi:5'-deoxynucleotidase YfbR-like HD superfamily hydrolase
MDQHKLMKQIDFIRKGGITKRYHTKNTLKDNTVAHHSFGVAWMCYLLSEGRPSAALLVAALAHDLAEQLTGDISSPTKRKFPVLAEMVQAMESEALEEHELNLEPELTNQEARVLKMADCMDGMLFCISEMELGNRSIYEVFRRYCDYVDILRPTGREHRVFSAIRLLMVPHESER